MLVVDASCLFEVVADTPRSRTIAERLASDTDHAAPEVIDVEVLGVIRAQYLRGALDELPGTWDVALLDPNACPNTFGPVRRCLWPDGSNCGDVADARWALCKEVSSGAIAGTIAVRGASAMKMLKGDAADLVAYVLIS